MSLTCIKLRTTYLSIDFVSMNCRYWFTCDSPVLVWMRAVRQSQSLIGYEVVYDDWLALSLAFLWDIVEILFEDFRKAVWLVKHGSSLFQVTGVVGRAETLSSVFFVGAFILYGYSTKEKNKVGELPVLIARYYS